MPPKKAAAAAAATGEHPNYRDMIGAAISTLKDRSGSSRQAIKKYIEANFKINPKNFESQFKSAIARGIKTGDFLAPKGPSGSLKLAKKQKAGSTAPADKKEKTPTAMKKPAAAAAIKKMPVKKTSVATKAKKPAAAKAKKPAAAKAKKPAAAKAKKVPAAKKAAAPKKAAAKVTKPKKAAAPKKAKAAAPKKAKASTKKA